MENFFDEKTHQIEPDTLQAFGIEIQSRYGSATDIIEMVEFARLVALSKISHYVNRLFYDSKATICNIDLTSAVKKGDPVAVEILAIADKTITQFILLDEHHVSGELDNGDGLL